MPKFTDTKGREWEVAIDVTAVGDLKDRLKLRVGTAEFHEAMGDPCQVANILYVLCEDQCKKAGVDDREFGRGLAGDVIERANDALYEAYVLFSPSDRRKPLKLVADKGKTVGAALTRAKTAQAEALAAIPDDLLGAALEKLVAAGKPVTAESLEATVASLMSSPSAGGSPGSSGSTPAA